MQLETPVWRQILNALQGNPRDTISIEGKPNLSSATKDVVYTEPKDVNEALLAGIAGKHDLRQLLDTVASTSRIPERIQQATTLAHLVNPVPVTTRSVPRGRWNVSGTTEIGPEGTKEVKLSPAPAGDDKSAEGRNERTVLHEAQHAVYEDARKRLGEETFERMPQREALVKIWEDYGRQLYRERRPVNNLKLFTAWENFDEFLADANAGGDVTTMLKYQGLYEPFLEAQREFFNALDVAEAFQTGRQRRVLPTKKPSESVAELQTQEPR